jgi:transcription elongation factor
MTERINAHVVQTRKEIDRQGQETTAALSSMLARIKEQRGIATDNLSQEISKSKEYTDSKFNTVSRDIQDIKQHSTAEIPKLSLRVGALQG